MEIVTMQTRLAVANQLFWKTASFEKVAVAKRYNCYKKVAYLKSSSSIV